MACVAAAHATWIPKEAEAAPASFSLQPRLRLDGARLRATFAAQAPPRRRRSAARAEALGGFGETRLIGEPPSISEGLSVKDPKKGSDEEQDSFVRWAGDRKQPDNCEPAERTRDVTVPSQQADSSDGASHSSQRT
jgi:hypothetical protein